LTSRKSLSDYGFWPSLADVKLGVVAAFLILPHLLLLNYLINQVIEYEHPVLEMFGPQMTWQLFAMQAALTVVLAPLYEEFTFRALLQGGAEQLMRRVQLANPAEPQAEIVLADPVPASEVASSSWYPVLISSAVFASLHLQHGGGAIPIFVLALALGYLYRQTGRMGPGLVVHMILNGVSMLTAALGVWLER
ncbi:MAG: CPBP family intramembrane glutamic endopeptidase, partial [Planctomycetaceae bacterium]